MEKNARSLVDHWNWAADKGLMNGNTAAGLRSASTQVLQVIGDGWETTDITALDVDDLLVRFQNLKKKDYTPQVLELYKKRFRKALVSYLSYLENPGAWKPGTQGRPATSQRTDRSAKCQPATWHVYRNNRLREAGPTPRRHDQYCNLFIQTYSTNSADNGIIATIQSISTIA